MGRTRALMQSGILGMSQALKEEGMGGGEGKRFLVNHGHNTDGTKMLRKVCLEG